MQDTVICKSEDWLSKTNTGTLVTPEWVAAWGTLIWPKSEGAQYEGIRQAKEKEQSKS
jgi:hypothetical protein